MFADPQSVTINAVANSLPRVAFGTNSGAFAKSDGLIRLSFSHTYGKSFTQRLIRLDHSKIAADPFQTDLNVMAQMATWLVVRTPITGYSLTEQGDVVDGLTAYLTASSGANTDKLLGGES